MGIDDGSARSGGGDELQGKPECAHPTTSVGRLRWALWYPPRAGNNLFPDDLDVDFGELAHVIPASPDGPRGVPFDDVSLEDRAHHSNLILLCANCHTTIDKAPAAYPAELLYGWKQNRIEEIRVAGFGELLDALKCDDNIAEHIDSQVQYERRRLTYNKAVKWLRRKGYHAYQIGRYKLQPLTIVTSND